jgi:murein DD-endopeptidase MepM/ murein hydrolase activator NlpD
MLRNITLSVFLLILCFSARIIFAQAVSVSVFPAEIIQGEPFLAQIEGATEPSSIKKLTFDGKKVGIFMYQGKPSALVGIDLNKKPGAYELLAEFSDGSIIKKSINIGARKKIETPLGIPDKLGGNTKASQDKLIATLVAEKKSLANIRTGSKALWTEKFIPPLKEIFVTNPYGPSRITGAYSIPHKGTDYRAKIGTEVMAVNRGIVRVTKFYRNYGNTIVIDHGLGLMTYYLHLSKIKVEVGDVVEQRQIIGLSGDTGYTQGAHLHLNVNINNIAVDPVKFFELFQ